MKSKWADSKRCTCMCLCGGVCGFLHMPVHVCSFVCMSGCAHACKETGVTLSEAIISLRLWANGVEEKSSYRVLYKGHENGSWSHLPAPWHPPCEALKGAKAPQRTSAPRKHYRVYRVWELPQSRVGFELWPLTRPEITQANTIPLS